MAETTDAKTNARMFMKYFFFVFVFIVSFCLIKIRKVETFGLGMFFISNMLFCIFIGKDLLDGSIKSEVNNTEWMMRYGTLIVAMAFSFVSSIMMILTFVTLHKKFADNQSEIEWSPTNRQHLDDAETIFITVTTFIGVIAAYVYNSPEQVRKFVYTIFDTILNGDAAYWLRVIFPVVILGVGSALYGRLEMPLLEVSKKPNSIVCDPKNDPGIQQFKDSFIKTFWFLFAFIIVVVGRPFVEANFDTLGLYPSQLMGFKPGDRTLIFGQNPSISLLSLLTLGFSNLTGLNTIMKNNLTASPNPDGISVGFAKILLLIAFLPLIGFSIFISTLTTKDFIFWMFLGLLLGFALIMIVFMAVIFATKQSNTSSAKNIQIALSSMLLMPVLRWDLLYLGAKHAFGIVALVYASFTIRDFQAIPKTNPCLFEKAHIRQLYIAFITFLIIFYTFNTLSASHLTSLVTVITRYLVPPSLLGLSSYLVFVTDYLMKLSPQLIVQ